jgi:hypothetical protein
VYDGKPTPDWGQYLNLNALLALLSTFLRATLVLLVSQIISQRKWRYFSGHIRPLSHLQHYDSASRGGLGALNLLQHALRGDLITLLAAIILVPSFLVGPLVQQASRTVNCSFPTWVLPARVPYAHYVPGRRGYHRVSGAGFRGEAIPTSRYYPAYQQRDQSSQAALGIAHSLVMTLSPWRVDRSPTLSTRHIQPWACAASVPTLVPLL